MANTDLVLKFENTNRDPLVIIIDPPCEEFVLEMGQVLKLKILGYKEEMGDVGNIIDVQYTMKDVIYIDINYSFTMLVEFDGEERPIWRL